MRALNWIIAGLHLSWVLEAIAIYGWQHGWGWWVIIPALLGLPGTIILAIWIPGLIARYIREVRL